MLKVSVPSNPTAHNPCRNRWRITSFTLWDCLFSHVKRNQCTWAPRRATLRGLPCSLLRPVSVYMCNLLSVCAAMYDAYDSSKKKRHRQRRTNSSNNTTLLVTCLWQKTEENKKNPVLFVFALLVIIFSSIHWIRVEVYSLFTLMWTLTYSILCVFTVILSVKMSHSSSLLLFLCFFLL